jgi:hypothetical protein
MGDEYKSGIVITAIVTAFLALCVVKGCEHDAKRLEAQRACVVAGHTPLECGLVHVQ